MVDGSIGNVSETFQEMGENITGVHTAPNFLELFLLVKGSMEIVSPKFNVLLEDKFKKKKDSLLRKNS